MDPHYFLDGIHMTKTGVWLQAWIAMIDLLPRMRERLESGAWPRTDREALKKHPGIGPIRTVEGLGSAVLPHPYHMPAIPTPRFWNEGPLALASAASTRARSQ